MLTPASLDELTDAVRSTPRVLAVGAGTKPRLSAVDALKISMIELRGISEYDPSEFTITALAGTPVREIASALAERGQYLPFDPMLIDAGATLGGTVAAGLSGPGRFRFGGLRDFILGVRFVDGAGRILRMGAKVVKNAAGFDLPKFFVGSLGRFGVLAEITFKVFPRPASSLTLKLEAETMDDAARLLTELANSRFEFDALEIPPVEILAAVRPAQGKTGEPPVTVSGSLPETVTGKLPITRTGEPPVLQTESEPAVLARLAGPASALEILSREILTRWRGELLSGDHAETVWTNLREFRSVGENSVLAKVALSPASVAALANSVRILDGAQMHVSAGGNVAFISLVTEAQAGELDARLQALGLSGVALRGEAPLWLGSQPRPAIAAAVKKALDPQNRFPSLDD